MLAGKRGSPETRGEKVFHSVKEKKILFGSFLHYMTRHQMNNSNEPDREELSWGGAQSGGFPVTLAPHLTSGGSSDMGWDVMHFQEPQTSLRRDANVNHHYSPLSPLFLSEPISIPSPRNHQPQQRGSPRGAENCISNIRGGKSHFQSSCFVFSTCKEGLLHRHTIN